MKHWIGRWLMGVAIIHTLFALVFFHDVLLSIVRRGVFNTVGEDPMVGAVVWFVLFGAVLFLAGHAISALEQATFGVLPRSIGIGILLLAITGVVLMPASGFWLAFPAAIAALVRRADVRRAEPDPVRA